MLTVAQNEKCTSFVFTHKSRCVHVVHINIYCTCDIFSFKGGLGGIPEFYMCFVTLPPKNSLFFYPNHMTICGGRKTFSHEDMCSKMWGVNSKGTSHQRSFAYVPNQLLNEEKGINNKCAILIYYNIINKYLYKRYSFKDTLCVLDLQRGHCALFVCCV